MEEYDLAVIGAGPGGYVAGLRAAQRGLKTVVIEKEQIGGVCLNRGCIPTKTLLESAKLIRAINKADTFGIKVENIQIEPSKLWQRKEQVVRGLRGGIEYLFKARGVNFINGEARLIDKNTIELDYEQGRVQLKAKNIIIAAGSSPSELPNIKFDHKCILSSDDILELKRIPKSLVIVGGGVIGCEFASFFSSFGTSVTVIELLESLLPEEDREISKTFEVNLKRRGIVIKTKTKLESVAIRENGVEAALSDQTKLSAELILICVGRKPNSSALGLEKAGVKQNKGWIKVDEYLRTDCGNIYAIGDVTGKVLLAHVASYQAETAVENILGGHKQADYSFVPNCIFTYPEIASIGLNENKAKELNLDYLAVKFPFRSLGKSHTTGETEGFMKLLIDKKNTNILGAQIIGQEATELIAGLGISSKNRLKAEEIAGVIFAHPTLSEIIPETLFTFFKMPLHRV